MSLIGVGPIGSSGSGSPLTYTPRVLAALLDMQTALQGIRTDNGYFYDVKDTSVVLDPVALDTVPTGDVPFIVIDVEASGQNIVSGISKPNACLNDFVVPLRCRVDAPSDGDVRSALRIAAWQFYADVETALCFDLSRGAAGAQYTYVDWPTFYFGLAAQRIVCIEIPVRIVLKRDYGRP